MIVNLGKLKLIPLVSPNQRSVIWGPMNKPRNKSTYSYLPGSPFGRIPNVQKFSIIPGALDLVWLSLGLNKKMKPTLKFDPWKNKGANRFIRQAERTLAKLRVNPLAY